MHCVVAGPLHSALSVKEGQSNKFVTHLVNLGSSRRWEAEFAVFFGGKIAALAWIFDSNHGRGVHFTVDFFAIPDEKDSWTRGNESFGEDESFTTAGNKSIGAGSFIGSGLAEAQGSVRMKASIWCLEG